MRRLDCRVPISPRLNCLAVRLDCNDGLAAVRLGSGLVDDLAAGGFDRRPRALGDLDALEGHRLGYGAREHHLGALGRRRYHTGLLQRLEIDDLARDPRQLAEPDFGARRRQRGAEADLRQPPLNGHLAALEADLVVAALARALSLDTPAAGLALAGGGAASHAQPGPLGTGRGLECVESHDRSGPSSARPLDLEEVLRGLDHAAILRGVDDRDRLVDAAQSQAARAGGDVGELAVQALDERDLQLLALHCVHARQPVISSRLLPRFAAMSSGERIFASAFTVARTTLIGLREP